MRRVGKEELKKVKRNEWKMEVRKIDPLSCWKWRCTSGHTRVRAHTHTHTHICTRTRTHTHTHRMRPAESVWLTVLSELRTLWGGKGRGGGGTEQKRGWIGKGWRSIRREAEVSGVSERRSRGFGEACYSQLLLLQHLCVLFLRVHVQECVSFRERPSPMTLPQNAPCRLSSLQSICRAEWALQYGMQLLLGEWLHMSMCVCVCVWPLSQFCSAIQSEWATESPSFSTIQNGEHVAADTHTHTHTVRLLYFLPFVTGLVVLMPWIGLRSGSPCWAALLIMTGVSTFLTECGG